MATPQEKLAESLDALRKLQDRGVVAIRAADLSRAHRERLLKNGFLQEVMKGWYIPARPDDAARESTAWYASFWAFCAAYLRERFGSEWCLSPEQSLSLHAGNHAVPPQLVVRASRGGNKATALPHGTSLLDLRAAVPEEKDIEVKDGLRLVLIARSADCQLARVLRAQFHRRARSACDDPGCFGGAGPPSRGRAQQDRRAARRRFP